VFGGPVVAAQADVFVTHFDLALDLKVKRMNKM